MKTYFCIGDFRFSITYPETVSPPEHFMIFQTDAQESEYDYTLSVVDELPQPEGKLIAQREDILVCGENGLESRLLGIKGWDGHYACYRETSERSAEILFAADCISKLRIDPAFTSLLALERRLVKKDALILHCAYTSYRGEAILFSAPSETGKTTQANLWGKYRSSQTINGDKSLLQCVDGRWTAQGWPVCGTSEVCHNIATPIRAIVMLSQGKTDVVSRLSPIQAYSQLYSQVTVNGWNRDSVDHTLNLIGALIGQIPVYHLSCTISEHAVACLEQALYGSEER